MQRRSRGRMSGGCGRFHPSPAVTPLGGWMVDMEVEQVHQLFETALVDSEAQRARRATCELSSRALVDVGHSLWVGGWLLRDDIAKGLAVLVQTAGELAVGSCELVVSGHPYAAGPPLRSPFVPGDESDRMRLRRSGRTHGADVTPVVAYRPCSPARMSAHLYASRRMLCPRAIRNNGLMPGDARRTTVMSTLMNTTKPESSKTTLTPSITALPRSTRMAPSRTSTADATSALHKPRVQMAGAWLSLTGLMSDH